MTTLNNWHYFGDVSPLCGGVIVNFDDNGINAAYSIGEFAPISYAYSLVEIDFNDASLYTLDAIMDAYYEGEYTYCTDNELRFMRALDWEYSNESNKDVIDKFVRYDFNVMNLIKRFIGLPLRTKIH